MSDRDAETPDSPWAPPASEIVDPVLVDRPEGLVTANPLLRLVAVILNSLIFMACLLPMIVTGVLTESSFDGTPGPLFGDAASGRPQGVVAASLVLSIVLFVAVGVVNLVMIHRGGWTIGKRMVGIRVVTLDGRPAGIGRVVLVRELAFNLILGLLNLFFLIVGTLLSFVDMFMVFARQGRTLHDRLAGTRVVRADTARMR